MTVPCPLWLPKAVLKTDMTLGPAPPPMPRSTRLQGTSPCLSQLAAATHLPPAHWFPPSTRHTAAYLSCGLAVSDGCSVPPAHPYDVELRCEAPTHLVPGSSPLPGTCSVASSGPPSEHREGKGDLIEPHGTDRGATEGPGEKGLKALGGSGRCRRKPQCPTSPPLT